MPPTALFLQIGSALAVGILIGIERGWQLRGAQEGMRVAGVRTFSLLGLVAGLAGLLGTYGYELVSAILVVGTVAVTGLGYWQSMKSDELLDATSPVAAIITLALGFLGGSGEPALAVAGGAVVTLILALRAELHGLISALDESDVQAFARYAVIALAVFPFLPEGRFGPYDAWEPQTLWFVVVIVTGFSFVGYVANRRLAQNGAPLPQLSSAGHTVRLLSLKASLSGLALARAAGRKMQASRWPPQSCICA